jgi:hypothetical protein
MVNDSYEECPQCTRRVKRGGMRKHFSHTPGHNPLFTSTSMVRTLANLHASYNLQQPLLLSSTVLHSTTDGWTAPPSDEFNNDGFGANEPRPDPSEESHWQGQLQSTSADRPEDTTVDDAGTGTEEDLDLVVDGMEGLSAIEICEVEHFPSADPMVQSGLHPVQSFN